MDWDQFADNNGLTKKQDSKYWDEEEPHFYVLDEEFETIAETGKKLIGSYKWWKAALVGKSHLSGEDINLANNV